MKKIGILIIIFLIFVQCFDVHAKNSLSESEKLDFQLKMKEYACKIYYPDLRSDNPAISKRDIENLQKNILRKISKSPEYYNEYVEFIYATPSVSAAFSSFNKSIQQKNKFEMLEKQTKSTSYNIPKLNNSNNQKYKPTLAEKMLFKYKFNSTDKDERVNISRGNPETTQKYQKILQEFQQITDFETLKKKGPYVIEQSEEILTRNTEDLEYADQISNLVTISGLCHVRLKLGSAWDGTDTPDIMKQVVEYMKTVYNKATVTYYKYHIGLSISRSYEGLGSYGEAFNFCYTMKNDLYEKLSWNDKTDLLLKIADELTRKCPKDETYMKLSVSCYRLYIQEIDNDPDSDTQNKIIKKLQTLIYGVVATYEFYEKYIEAISVLDEVITAPDCPDFIRADAETKKKILQELVKIKINVKFGNKFMGNDGWKIIDKPYKYIGAYTGDSIRLKVEMETPPGVQINFDSIDWHGENVNSGDQQINISCDTPGQKEINLEVTIFEKKINRVVKIYVIEKPTGVNDERYAFDHKSFSLIAAYKNLVGNGATLEPSIWAAKQYNTVGQHNTIADAARHAYWNCLLTRYCDKEYAKGLTYAHEVGTKDDLFIEVIMDLHNNAEGRTAVNHEHTSDNSCCQNAIIKAVSDGVTLYLDDIENKDKSALLQPTNN